jgi:hypothetical protein
MAASRRALEEARLMHAAQTLLTGTDTGVGKTVFAAGLAGALGARLLEADAGRLEDADRHRDECSGAGRLTARCPAGSVSVAERPLSPHLAAAAIDDVRISPEAAGAAGARRAVSWWKAPAAHSCR